MKLKTQFIASFIGTIIVGLCCFTPVLVILLGVLGSSALVGYLDYCLVPALETVLKVFDLTKSPFIRGTLSRFPPLKCLPSGNPKIVLITDKKN